MYKEKIKLFKITKVLKEGYCLKGEKFQKKNFFFFLEKTHNDENIAMSCDFTSNITKKITQKGKKIVLKNKKKKN